VPGGHEGNIQVNEPEAKGEKPRADGEERPPEINSDRPTAFELSTAWQKRVDKWRGQLFVIEGQGSQPTHLELRIPRTPTQDNPSNGTIYPLDEPVHEHV
jgi:hypothetical protein